MADKLTNLLAATAGEYDAFLYDCDGTLADTMPAHKESYVAIAKGLGFDLDASIIDEFAGLPEPLVIAKINERYNTRHDALAFAEAKSHLFYEQYVEHILPVQFVVDHLLAHHGKLKIGVVSGGGRKTVLKTLEILGILDKVDVVVCAGETPEGKPSPQPFLKAAELLGVQPSRCFVFEDGDAGVRSAIAAGMKWVRIDQIL
jgi:HAD superfamily hydrolase (TIGR01509 family)